MSTPTVGRLSLGILNVKTHLWFINDEWKALVEGSDNDYQLSLTCGRLGD